MLFAIQSLPRCGTHLLRTSLESHGQIVCYGEVFNPNDKTHGFPCKRPTVAEVVRHCQERVDPTGFLAHAYVGLAESDFGPGLDQQFRQRSDVQAAQGLWNSLPPSTPIVTLWRSNLLARYVSACIARKNDKWQVYLSKPMPAPIKIKIDCRAMFADFARTESLIAIAQNRFPVAMRVSYEQLVTDSEDILAAIQSLLQMPIKSLKPSTVKVGRPIRESIINFKEVQSALKNTPYNKFLQ
jgi:hypothetical protein